ncbi:hypothetical protein GI482_00325 [Bacillus sp. N3536]|nr:hypothetical protein GI482_00325 [Bacillus sp. N3536]
MLTNKEVLTFDEIVTHFPQLFEQLINSQKYNFGALTRGSINTILKTDNKNPISGVYLISNTQNAPLYVGRSRNIAQRIGTDHRSTDTNLANLTYKIAQENNVTPLQAREYMYGDFEVQMITIDNDYARTLFEVYAAMKLQTPYNSFREA